MNDLALTKEKIKRMNDENPYFDYLDVSRSINLLRDKLDLRFGKDAVKILDNLFPVFR